MPPAGSRSGVVRSAPSRGAMIRDASEDCETTSRRLADRKTAKFQKNITRRGSVPETTIKKGNDYPVGPVVLGFFIFVVIGSSLFQIIRTATSGGMA
uniref:Stress-associated endoplasmic reticulum protein n=1 Tax=Setaria italica TaxID=4555 RepID=K3ZKI0_SETIT